MRATGIVFVLLINVMLLLTGAARAGEVDEWVNLGDRAAAQGRWSAAAEYFKMALAVDRGNARVWRKYNRAFMANFRMVARFRAQEDARRRVADAERKAAEEEALAKSMFPSAATTTATSALDPHDVAAMEIKGVSRIVTPGESDGGKADVGSTGSSKGADTGKSKDKDEEEKPPVYSPSERVYLSAVRRTFDRLDGPGSKEKSSIETVQYKITDVSLGFGRRGLTVRGRLENLTSRSFRVPRVYVAIYDAGGQLRGRTFGYCKPGRFVLPAGRTKDFEVRFPGYNSTVGSYRIEIVTNL